MSGLVSDTGPILHLIEAESLHVLGLLGDIHIPAAVDQELAELAPTWLSQRPPWVVVEALAPPYRDQAATWQESRLLHAGEAEALALARQRNADWLLTDDAAARLAGQALGLEVHGSLGVVLWAAAQGQLSEGDAAAALEGLIRSSLWVSAKAVEKARAALKAIFGRP